MKLETQLHEEIVEELNDLSKLTVGSEQHKTAVDGVTKLMDRAIELERLETTLKREADQQEFEQRFKIQQNVEAKKDRKVQNILTGVGIAAPMGVSIWMACKSLKFEETGTFTTIVGRGIFGKMFPKIK